MTAKKKWFSKLHEPLKLDGTISWSSDSEPEHKIETIPAKKLRILTKKQTGGSKYFPSKHTTPQKRSEDKNCQTFTEAAAKSPVIVNFQLKERSPLLTHTSDVFVKEPSPVINNRSEILNLIRSKLRKTSEKPEIFDIPTPSRSSDFIIEETQSDIVAKTNEDFHISQVNSESGQSQSLSHLLITSNEPQISTDSSSTDFSSIKRRKAQCKKGGLAHQMEKAIHLQKSRIAFWQHEQFKSRTSPSEDNVSDSQEGEALIFVLNSKRKEYGHTILECSRMDDNGDFFVVVLGHDCLINVSFSEGRCFKMVAPYSVRSISYKNREVDCFFNTHSFIMMGKAKHKGIMM